MTVVGFYVSTIDGSRRALLHGPFVDHASAYALVTAVRRWANGVNSDSWFYGFGTASARADSWAALPRPRHSPAIAAHIDAARIRVPA